SRKIMSIFFISHKVKKHTCFLWGNSKLFPGGFTIAPHFKHHLFLKQRKYFSLPIFYVVSNSILQKLVALFFIINFKEELVGSYFFIVEFFNDRIRLNRVYQFY